MLIVILRRLALSIPLLFVVSLVTFLLVSLSPTDVAYTLLGPHATPQQLEAVREELGLNAPLWQQYLNWVGGAFRGDLGSSLISRQPVLTAVGQRVEPTLALLITTMLVIAVVGVALGIWGALRGGVVARILDALGLLGIAIPGFLVGLFLIIVFSVQLRWLPSVGYTTLADGFGPWIRGMILPVTALAVGSVGLIAKQVRASMLDALGSEFIRNLTANGLHRGSVIYKHVLRSASVPVLAVMGVTLVGLLGGSVLIEQVFGIPGVGGLAVQATLSKDLPLVQGVAVVYTLIVIVVNIVLDVMYALANPKVRVS
jgi:peptide/nickel transport system permease protein